MSQEMHTPEPSEFTLYEWPQELEAPLEKLLKLRGHSLLQPARLAPFIKTLSDHFTSGQKVKTPWADADLSAAYLAYFFPLNYLRLRRVFDHAVQAEFFAGLSNWIDLGSGPSTWDLVRTHTKAFNKPGWSIDSEPQALECGKRLLANASVSSSFPASHGATTLLSLSYSLNEMEWNDAWLDSMSAIMIVEPATQQQARRLMELRQLLINRGFHIWAPCLHQGPCPLLTQSKRDWCHERVHIKRPKWFEAIEKHLPMTNRTLTFSYLLARKSEPIVAVKNKVRILGDTLDQKGKTVQQICRGPDREVLSWLHRHGIPKRLESGSLHDLPAHQKKGHELRVE